jgi:hypothetical protein
MSFKGFCKTTSNLSIKKDNREGTLMGESTKKKANRAKAAHERSALIEKIDEAVKLAIEEYKAENPGANVEEILPEHNMLLPELLMLRKRELDKFVTYAKEQGTKMSFDTMEMGVLAAGRKDMQESLSEILDTVKFDKPTCSECGDEMNDRGRSKKNS